VHLDATTVSLEVMVFFSSRRRHTRSKRDWSSDVCSSDLWCEAGEWLRARPLRMILVGSAAWCWVVASVVTGFAEPHALATCGLAAFVSLSAHWWRIHRIGYPTPQKPTPAKVVAEDAEHIAA